MSVYYIICTVPKNIRNVYGIRNRIECLVSSSKLYNGDRYHCKCVSMRISNRKFYFTSSHMAHKIIHTIQTYYPEIEITLDRRPDWKH